MLLVPGEGYVGWPLLLEKVTWNLSCSLGYLEQLLLPGKVTWSGSCLCGEGPQFQPRKEDNFFKAVCALNSNNL